MAHVRLLASILALGLGAAAWAADDPPPAGRCLKDSLERWWCAADPKGFAVHDNLGSVVCAPGQCVEVADEWECSSVSGGKAERTPDGAVCEGECRQPRETFCELRATEP